MKKNGYRLLFLAAALLALVCAWTCGFAAETDPLSYKVLEDGTGVQVVHCDPMAESVTIPAEHDGLPVVSIADGAFSSCTELREVLVEEGQKVFYAEDGVLFTDRPVKTLVLFPARNKHFSRSYVVPKGTVAIGPYAFAAQAKLEYLHLPKGVKSLGDGVFAGVSWEMCVFVPNSLTEFGRDLLQGQQDNVPFFGDWKSEAAAYAKEHQIPFAGVWDPDRVKDTAGHFTPDLADAEDAPAADPDRTMSEDAREGRYEQAALVRGFHLADRQLSAPSEIRLNLDAAWRKLGTDESGMPAQTGVYGFGHTEEAAWIRGYAADGSVAGTRKAEGDFIFSLPGAVNMGVIGGKGTFLQAMPYEPAWISEPGVVSLECGGWDRSAEDEAFRYFVFMFQDASINLERPAFLNMMSYSRIDADPDHYSYDEYPDYSMVVITMRDPALYHLTDCTGMNVDALETLLEAEADGFAMKAKKSFHVDKKSYPQKILKAWQEVKKAMQGTYFPQDTEILPVSIVIDGSYPTTGSRCIRLNANYIKYESRNMIDFVHEMVHAVDQTYDNWYMVPSPWMEGRAEYISRKICAKAGYKADPYPKKYDWSFLSQADREDFWRYFCESTNRETTYPVGYYFFDYLCRTWGEDISVKILKALDGKMEYGDKANERFREALESVTEKGVFQSFVRDVIEKGK